MIHLNRSCLLCSVLLPLLGLSPPAQATEPALARLCLWLPPERVAGFESAYQEKLAPLLKQHGLVESPQRGRATVDSVFSRLFAFDSAAQIAAVGQGLQQDSLWQEALQSTGVGQWHWGVYAMTAGPGRTAEAGSGFRQGLWQSFGAQDGLPASEPIQAIFQDRAGNLWFGGWEGVSRYDGARFTTFTMADGLVSYGVKKIAEDREGNLWFSTLDGVSRYDGAHFTTFTAADGLADNLANAVLKDRDGQLWFAFADGGVSQYDGVVFQSLSRKDGLPNDAVQEILQDRKGEIWIGTEGGLVRYRPSHTPPAIRLVNVSADQRYGPVAQLQLSALQDYLLFEFQGASLATPPERMAYVYRLVGYEEEWRPSYVNRVEYADLPLGEYVFEVKAVDQDLNYSEQPAAVKVTVHPPYGQLALGGGLALALIGLVFASGTAMRRRRAQLRAERALMRELEKELQTAHELQMGLMPKEAPQIPGLDLAGHCLPANHVGGDLFQYFPQSGRFSIALADVTGHAMEAAIPMMVFSGMLKSQMEAGHPIENLFGNLNRSLHGALSTRTFICFALGELDPVSRRFRFANAGCPYPYHYRAATGEVMELQLDAYPLGVRPDTAYRVIEVQLEPGDRVVFCSDGIIEAANGAGEQFGFGRTEAVIRRGCQEGLSAESLLARIMAEVKEFRGETPQGDDQTVVVLKVEK